MAVTAAELALYRNIIEEEFLATDVCTIQTRSWTDDDMGGGSYTYAAAATAVPCRLTKKGIISREAKVGGQVKVHDLFSFSVHWDRSLDETMRIVLSGGDTLEVIHVDDVHTERLSKSADVVRVG